MTIGDFLMSKIKQKKTLHPMDKKLAVSFLTWLENAHIETISSDLRGMHVVMLRDAPAPVWDLLERHIALNDYWHTPRGLGIQRDALKWLIHSAEAARPRPYSVESPQSPDTPFETFTAKLQREQEEKKKAAEKLKSMDPKRTWTVCSEEALKTALQNKNACSTRANDPAAERQKFLQKIQDRRVRTLPPVLPDHLEQIASLKDRFPHFSEVITWIGRALRLNMRLGQPLRLPAFCLNGPPGTGKTFFLRELAGILKMHLVFRSLAELSASFVLTGASSTWKDAGPGLIARCLAEMPDESSPLFVLDELDKTQHGNFPVDTCLLGLLESSSAGVFTDEFLNLTVDVRPYSWAFTCNDLGKVRAEIKSRLTILDVGLPDAHQMPDIVRSVDYAVRSAQPGFNELFEPLGEEVVDCLKVMATRDLKTILNDAYAIELERSPDGSLIKITTDSVVTALRSRNKQSYRRPMGFVS